jgi:hypothetical protein
MFGELFEKIFRLEESEKTIRTIYKIYKDHERRLDPDIVDLDIALEGMEEYYVEYMEWWDHGYGKEEPKELKKAYKVRYNEIVAALSSKDTKDKIIALDNAINQWHVDFPVIAHLSMETENEELVNLIYATGEILRRLGRLPEESPYNRR